MHLHLARPWRASKISSKICVESSLACSEGLPSTQLFALPAVIPPSLTLGSGQHEDTGCSSTAFPFLPPASWILKDSGHGPISQNFFFTYLPQNNSLALIFPSSLHPLTPQHQAQVLRTPNIPVPQSSQKHTQLQAPTASVFPPRCPPWYPQHHSMQPPDQKQAPAWSFLAVQR